jgi:hypothetical protein
MMAANCAAAGKAGCAKQDFYVGAVTRQAINCQLLKGRLSIRAGCEGECGKSKDHDVIVCCVHFPTFSSYMSATRVLERAYRLVLVPE